MKIITLFTIAIFSMSIALAQESNSNEEAIYVASEEFRALNLPFSQAVIYGGVIYVSGQIGNIGLKLVEGGIIPEAQQTMLNIKNILEENGSSMDHVIKCTCMLADMSEWPILNNEYLKFFPNNKPARSAFGTNGLALNARVEIECMAYLKNK
ncbi:RidA family protein [Algoriphagus halophilus]|uniref:Reactive intermediate/imine deaminase n=1 Tax=Algoriphagus halophilus TaxID=226505 RepID=A0A1N6D5E4_9BACT|nr:RidA family protein [Algoriphagus halophilus]SIN66038.1 reactive intermediate/imine deaminase [Algoriphagus halophilus]